MGPQRVLRASMVALLALFLVLVALAALIRGRRWLFARFYDRAVGRYERFQHDRRRALLAGVEGTVLEIGPGTGANLPFLAEAVAAGRSLRWIGVEPNPEMRRQLERRAAGLGFPIELRGADGGRLPAEDRSCDVVVATLVLCSVGDPDGLLAEIVRVLRPGGRFVFLEHVAAEPGTRTRRRQELLAPAWAFLADGCRLNRDTEARIQAAGFERVEVEAFVLPPTVAPAIVAPHRAGTGWISCG